MKRWGYTDIRTRFAFFEQKMRQLRKATRILSCAILLTSSGFDALAQSPSGATSAPTAKSPASAAPQTPKINSKPTSAPKSAAIVCTSTDGAAPLTLILNDNGAPTSVGGGLAALMVDRRYGNAMPMQRFLDTNKQAEATGRAHMLELPGPGATPPKYHWYVVVYSDKSYIEGIFAPGPGNPQNLIFLRPPGRCSGN